MSNKVTGIVTFVSSRKFDNNPKPIWSFAIGDGDNRIYYSTSSRKPLREDGNLLAKGDYVEFEFEVRGRTNAVLFETLSIVVPDVSPKKEYKKAAPKKQTENWDARAKYWEDKEKYDKEVAGPLLNYKFCLASAKDVVLELHKQELLPNIKKKADAYDVILEEIKKVTDDLYRMVHDKQRELEGFELLNPKEIEEPKEEEEYDDWEE